MTEYGTSEVFFKNRPVCCRFPFLRHVSDPSFVPQAWPASAAAKISEQGGMNLSSRVWNLNDCSRKELEAIIQNGIIEGKSPQEVSRDLRKYLNNPEALFRRVRNPKTGDLELSKAAKGYHPGQGVYRSAYKNARRLAVTEMNAAYRRAQWESYQKNPLVTAYEIRLSANHTTTIKGKIVPLEDICDQLAGRYPKTFLLTGWHPHCRCDFNKPITISNKAIKEWLNHPFADYKEKNEALLILPNLIEKAEYLGVGADKHNRNF